MFFPNHFFVSKHARMHTRPHTHTHLFQRQFPWHKWQNYVEGSISMLTLVWPKTDVNIYLQRAARQTDSLRRTWRPRNIVQAVLLITATITGLLLWIRLVAFALTSSRKISRNCFRISHSRRKLCFSELIICSILLRTPGVNRFIIDSDYNRR